jgi:uncharacterized membrane protein YqjE
MSMPARDSARSDAPPALFASLRNFCSILVSIAYARLDLVTVELEEQAVHAVQLIVISLAGLLCVGTAIFFLMFLLIALVWDTAYRFLALGGVFVFYVIASLILILVARKMLLNRPKFFEQTLTELRRDVEGLRPAPSDTKAKS